MKTWRWKKLISIALSVLMLTTSVASAEAATVSQFGDNTSRTHNNGINDPQYWEQAANLTSFTYNGSKLSVNGNSTAMGQGNMLYLPISATNDSPTGTGYLTAWDMGTWNKTTGEPAWSWSVYVKGASNSSPLIVNGNVYVAGGGTLYGFNSSGGQLATYPDNIYTANYIYQNQVVSHPLYANSEIWVSSQNGYLFAVNPTTLSRISATDIGSRMDGSPTLVQSTTGTSYIAVGTASASGNTGGTGTLYLVNMSGNVVAHLNNPAGNGSPIASAPIWTGGGIAWNDIAGDVFWAQFNGTSFTNVRVWKTGQSGLVTNEEAGYAGGYYILPQTTTDKTEVVNLGASGGTVNAFFTNADAQNNVGSPEISANYVYVPDALGNVNAFPVSSLSSPGSAFDTVAFAMGYSSLNLTNADEQMMPAENGQSVPTLAYLTNEGLQIWQNVAAPSVSLSASDTTTGGASSTTSISATVGDTVAIKASAQNVPKGDVVEVSVTKNTTPGTLSGSNSATSSATTKFEGLYDYSANATSSTAQSVTYYAVVIDPSTGQTDSSQSNQITVTWTSAQTYTISITANPPGPLQVGQSTTLTATTTYPVGSNKSLYIHDMSSDGTLSSSNVFPANSTELQGTLTKSTISTNAADNSPQTVEYEVSLQLPDGSYVHSAPIYVTWATSLTPGITASANPSSTTTGQSSVISYSTTDWQTDDYVTVSGSGTGASNVWNNSKDTNSSDSYTETENPQNGATTTVNYTFILYDQSGQKLAQATTTATWTSSIPTTTTLTFAANPLQLPVNSATVLSATVPPNPTGGAAPSGEFVEIYDQTTGQMIGAGAYTGSSNMTYGMSSTGETETYSISYSSSVAGSQSFIAYLWPPGVTPWNNSPSLTSNTQTVTWVQPSVVLSANVMNPITGEVSQISYATTAFASGDYVDVTSSGGINGWFATNDTNASDSYAEIENPTSGASMPVTITAKLYSQSGTLLSTSTITVTWTSPTISISANPQSNVPGEASTISYSVNVALPSGYSVTITPNGTGVNMWSATGLTMQSGSDKETESPASGQTISVNYTAKVLSPGGQILATGSTSVNWVNAFNGSINLSANPLFVATGKSTTLTATASTSIPSGWSLTIYDQTTGQMVGSGGSSPETAQYSSMTAETDTFVAYLNDGYSNVVPSNTVQVTWSTLALNANPTQLPAGSATTLTVSGQNVPSGDYLVIYNEGTGQTVGYSLSTPYSVSTSKSSPQTDNFVAYISSNTSNSGALISSNVVPVDWYGVNLVATPNNLPTGSTSTLTATAQNMPTGYELDIVDQTSGQIIASGQPGQTVLNALQTRSQVETDQYVANVVEPGNPVVPGMSMPNTWNVIGTIDVGSNPYGIAYGNGYVYVANDSSNTVSVINASTNAVTATINVGNAPIGVAYGNGYVYVANNNSNTVSVINASTNAVTATINVGYHPIGVTYGNGYVYVINEHSDGLGIINASTNVETTAVELSSEPNSVAYDPDNGNLYVTYYDAPVVDVINASTKTVTASINVGNDLGDVAYGNGYVYVANNNSNTVSVINASTNAVTATINVGNGPNCIAYGNGYVYVANIDSNTVSVINASTNAVTATINVGNGPWGVTYDPDNGSVYVTNAYSNTVSVIGMNETVVTNPLWGWTTIETVTPNPAYFTSLSNGADYTPIVYAPGNINLYDWSFDGSNYMLNPPLLTAPTTNYGATGDYGDGYGTVGTNGNSYMVTTWRDASNNLIWEIDEYEITSYTTTIVPTATGMPFFTFTSAPSYVPSSLFTQQAQASSDGNGSIWTSNSSSNANGTTFFQSTFSLPSTESVTFNIPYIDGSTYAQVYVDGVAVMQQGNSGGTGGSIANTSTATITLTAGMHQVIVEAERNSGFSSTSPGTAGVALNVSAGGTTLLTTATPSEWTTTGYVTQLPSGWFSGAIGTWNWTEYVMQESTSQPIYAQQAYSVTTAAAGVSATSTPVNVTWYQWQIGLTADPTSLQTGQSSTLTISSMEMPADGLLTITNEQNQTIYSGPVGQAYDTTTVASSVAATHTYTAHIMESGSDLLNSNSVSVTWTVPHQFLDTPQITGLLSDPGTPNYMWLPIPESQFENGVGPGGLWWPTFSQHGWNTEEQGGPDATQKVATVVANSLSTGQPLSVGIYSAQAQNNDPLVWARPASAFALRMVWHGPSNDWAAEGTATWTETNPDGDYVTWTSPIRVYPATDVTSTNGNEDSEAINTFTGLLPRLVYPGGVVNTQTAEPVAWGLGNTALEASSEGAHISVTLSLDDTKGANYTQTVNDVAILYSWPTWYMVGSH